MTCHDFERGWNDLLDAGGPRPALTVDSSLGDLERALQDHATECPACQQVAARYQVLRRAIGTWNTQPIPAVDLTDRILTAAQRQGATRWGSGMRTARPVWRIGLPLATAAAAALALVFVRPVVDGPHPDHRTLRTNPHPVTGNAPHGTFNTALADATAATLDLARSTSEPAARLSRQVLDAATELQPASAGDDRSGSFAVSVSSYVPATPDSTAASAILQQVGDSLTTSVGPLSTTARSAFGFLLGSPNAKPEARRSPPTEKGA